MVLNGLETLSQSMGRNGVKRQAFSYTLRGPKRDLQLSIAFILDEVPWALVFGVVGHNIAFDVPVRRGYVVYASDILKSTWITILGLLGVEYNPNDPFTREKFLQQLDGGIPVKAGTRNAYPHEIPRRMSVTEDADKIYFVRWLPHTGGKHVTAANLEKTEKYLGAQMAETCRKRNISSCWSAAEHEFNIPTAPP